MVIGEKITELRKKYNYTQENLAERIGVTRQTLSNWESNITSPDLKQASLLCKELKIQISDLIDNAVDIDTKEHSNNVLDKLINKDVFITLDYDNYYDLDIQSEKKVKILSIDDSFVKVEVNKNKIKLIDIDLIVSIKLIEED